VLDALRRRLPAAAAVAVFDTAFFAALPDHVRTYAVPSAWREGGAVRRYGFHGIAHAQLHRRYRALRRRAPAPERVITLHLGSGCSAAALLDGRPVETSMGYTPLEGLIMATRAGDLDAGIVIERLRAGEPLTTVEEALNRQSGLLGLSGRSADMRELLEHEARGDARAGLAVAAFLHRVVKYVGAYGAVLGGVDALLFGGGIGEGSAEIRRRICERVAWLGLELDARANEECTQREGSIAAHGSAVDAHVLMVHEELAIAEAVRERLGPWAGANGSDLEAMEMRNI
jgi:acetate kinase